MLHECGGQYSGASPALAAAPCTCGRLYGSCGGGCGGASAFSLLFPVAGEHCKQWGAEDGGSASVDCTLSLGTPSTRRAAEAGAGHAPGLSWDAVAAGCGGNGKLDGGRAYKEPGGGGGGGHGARRCANCDTTSTPLWRNGPRGPKSLCNACGIRYKKEERRAAAAAPPPQTPSDSAGAGYGYGCTPRQQQQQQWGCYAAAAAKTASLAMYGDVEGGDDGPCLSWRLNVMPSSPAFAVRERPSLFQYY